MEDSVFALKSFRKLAFRVCVIAIIGLLIFLGLKHIDQGYIREVKASTLEKVEGMYITYGGVPDMSYEEFFDQTCRSQKWKTFSSERGKCVELNAESNSGQQICIQFLYERPGYASIDGETVSPDNFFSQLYLQREGN